VALARDIDIGIGTGRFESRVDCSEVLRRAFDIGYRFVDTAQHYAMEGAVREALAATSVGREALFISYNVHSESLGYDAVHDAVDDALSRLDVEYLDAASVHWPAHTYEPGETLAALADLRAAGKIRAIGMSNATVEVLAEATERAEIAFTAVEFHPYHQPVDLLAYTRANDISMVAHTPLARGQVTRDDTVVQVAKRRGVTPGQLCLAWLCSKGIIPVPGSSGGHLRENFQATRLSVSDRASATLEALDEGRRLVDYDFAPWHR